MAVVKHTLANPIEPRTASNLDKDSRTLNGYFEKRADGTKDFVKRPGFANVPLTGTLPSTYPANGMWSYAGYIFACWGQNIYRIDSSFTVVMMSGPTLALGGNRYGAMTHDNVYMCFQDEYNFYYSAAPYTSYIAVNNTTVYDVLILTGGTGYTQLTTTVTFTAAPAGGTTATGNVVVVGGVVTGITLTNTGNGYINPPVPTITDSGATPGTGATAQTNLNGYPANTPLADGIVYMDGYVVIATQAGLIYNSDNNNPANWGAINYTLAQAEPDNIVAICKHFNYICVFKQWSTEFFWDAGLVSVGTEPGSPFQRQDAYRSEVGGISDTIQEFEQGTIFAGKSRTHGAGVFVLDSLIPTKVSTRYIDKFLNANLAINGGHYSFMYKIQGHTFYVLTLYQLNVTSSIAKNNFAGVTLVYDLEEKEWYMWSVFDDISVQNYFFPQYCVEFTNALGGTTYYGLMNNTLGMVNIDPSITSDYTSYGATWGIWMESITPIQDYGNTKKKFFTRVEVVGDMTPLADAVTVFIEHSDDDYTTWSNQRMVQMNAPTAGLPGRAVLYQEGSARRRAYDFAIFDSTSPIRLNFAEMDVIGGEDQDSKG